LDLLGIRRADHIKAITDNYEVIIIVRCGLENGIDFEFAEVVGLIER
jgi:hypothetical protein